MSWAALGLAIRALASRGIKLAALYPLQALLIAACALGVWQWHGKRAALSDLASARQTIAGIKKAQTQATADQVAVNHAPAQTSRKIAEQSDEHSPQYYQAVRRAGAAYAAAHPVRLQCPSAGSALKPADLRGADHPAALDDGPGEPAQVVAIPRADFDLLTGNSARLAQVHQDAHALIDAGVAVEAGQ